MKFRDPASMSKAMTLYLVFETMSKGEISEETVITATPTDQAIVIFMKSPITRLLLVLTKQFLSSLP